MEEMAFRSTLMTREEMMYLFGFMKGFEAAHSLHNDDQAAE